MGATGSRLQVSDESCLSWLGMLAGSHTDLDDFAGLPTVGQVATRMQASSYL